MIAKISLLGRDVYDLTDLIFNPSSYCQKIEEVKREPEAVVVIKYCTFDLAIYVVMIIKLRWIVRD